MSHRVPLRTLALVSVLLLVSACSKKEAPETAKAPAEIGVIVAKATPTSVASELPGRLEPYREAEVRARVAGIVTRRLYEEGQEVARGAPLFQIDPAPLQAAYDSEAAALARAQANLSAAADKLRRYADLVSDRAISERDHAESVAEERQARAEVALAKANLQSARLRLEYARVTSPIDGRARRALVTEGALVGEGQATPLTVVQQLDPIYVNFSQPAAEVMQLQKQIRAGALEGVAPDKMRVRLLLPDGSEYGQGGTLSFADLAVDPGTDNVTMRALFDNPDRVLLPGMYVRVRLEQAVNRDTYLVPRDALLRNADGAHLLVAGDDGELRSVAVAAHRLLGPNWVITEGLEGGERVVVENAAQLAPGQKIKPVERAAPSAPVATAGNNEKR
ncbi:MexX/AxyX family multidrug efflux RND transporter periplasmic adaptor subunit [Achromobacter xylosoxidans]|jgi:multidrug efflux system membrane fusion protein|uniref:MexX/AxyX family multidrug efflux RND transporter periplasmic adaptor subunit n=1 Tax=Alcaligenes xylosoxydans xylosoxydans TaxID=85698 RepID=A0A9X3R2H3_ALCXX|nr:MexX/AxyX family multidrug efflux RND transporter periplasmic adaptor subunit [Achromobacter xylosoxidans]KWU18526.1 multidrug transporter [Achromobacter xylosoxidans]MCZ8400322.1 MexX/AxyX family multidrug efflux RND transporter periplasmic adaptor subunit [Achromobacter xylosoxidans]CUJ50286.1 Acriflavine resistance protein A precursor [Achromobacter xylosoxidans]CUR75226.1 Acriflavine resistance protein A precursor [Achromobacter xylosoxidans]